MAIVSSLKALNRLAETCWTASGYAVAIEPTCASTTMQHQRWEYGSSGGSVSARSAEVVVSYFLTDTGVDAPRRSDPSAAGSPADV